MFGADTHLVFDAMQMVAIAAGVTGGAVYLMMRRKRQKPSGPAIEERLASNGDLEERVRVLERIATDPATRLAEEFEQLERAGRRNEEGVG